MKTSKLTFWRTLKKIADRKWQCNSVAVAAGLIRQDVSKVAPICPVCAVANELLGRTYYWLEADSAARAIGLDVQFAHDVANAADGRINHPMGQNSGKKVIEGIRRQLMKVLGL